MERILQHPEKLLCGGWTADPAGLHVYSYTRPACDQRVVHVHILWKRMLLTIPGRTDHYSRSQSIRATGALCIHMLRWANEKRVLTQQKLWQKGGKGRVGTLAGHEVCPNSPEHLSDTFHLAFLEEFILLEDRSRPSQTASPVEGLYLIHHGAPQSFTMTSTQEGLRKWCRGNVKPQCDPIISVPSYFMVAGVSCSSP